MGLYRLAERKMVSGVLAGVAEKYLWDVSIVRLVAVFLTIFTGVWPGVVTYIAGAVIIPDKRQVSQ
jgi:phage shock protein PspC (stress-responsive transcriptional regulator)